MNALNEYINFERNNIINFSKEILSTYYDEELFSKLLDVYIKIRYYNYDNNNSDTIDKVILEALTGELKKLIVKDDKETNKKLKEMYLVFYYVLMFDGVIRTTDKKLVSSINKFRKELFDENDMLFKEKIENMIASVKSKRKQYMNLFKSNDFEVKGKSTSVSNVFDLKLKHKIDFPKIYSEYAIERVYNTGNISEDKLKVLYYLTCSIIIKNVNRCIYDNYYLVEFAPSLFDNKDKLASTLDIVDNDIFKDKVYFKIDYKDYGKYTSNVKDMIKLGYKFILKCEDEDLKDDSFIISSMFDYILVNKDSTYLSDGNKNIICIK